MLNQKRTHKERAHETKAEKKIEEIIDVGCGNHCRGDIGIDVARTRECDVIGDAHFLPFRDGCFEHLFAQALLEHLQNPSEGLGEFMRVLKANGTATLIVPKPWFTNNCRFILVRFLLNLPLSLLPSLWKPQFARLTWLKRDKRTRHKSIITKSYMERQAIKNRFEIVEFKEMEDVFYYFFPRRVLRRWRVLRKFFSFKPKLYDCHSFVCRKLH